jgi:hypothetical protein
VSIRDTAVLIFWFLVGACVGRGGSATATLPLVRSPVQAEIGRDAARFVFPPESGPTVRWDVPSPNADTTRPDFYWTVIWRLPAPRGTVPTDLNLVLLAAGWSTRGHLGAAHRGVAPDGGDGVW